MKTTLIRPILYLLLLALPISQLVAEEEEGMEEETPRVQKKQKTKYFIEDTSRVDAGIFHVAFAAGGNFYIEPKFDQNDAPLGTYFDDFGFQAGIYFDYDYTDTPLGLRGYVGYKYILSSVHVFDVEGITRMLFHFSKDVQFALGAGVSSAVWFRSITDTSFNEETIFLPSLVLNAGFDFNPFMTDFKMLINRIGDNSTIFGMELNFGFRL